MKKTFRISFRNKFFTLALALIWLIPLGMVINFLYVDGLSLVVLMVPILFGMILFNFSILTYRVVIENGEVHDWDMLHKTRCLKINEIQYIRPRSYIKPYFYLFFLKRRMVSYKEEAPQFINEKFRKKFPRYTISQEVASFMKDNYKIGAF